MVDIENNLRQAIRAIKAGDKTTGRELLTHVVKIEPKLVSSLGLPGGQRNNQPADASPFFLSTLMG